ncbi:tRNA modification GTPase gtpbp3, mitochondrial [Coemansia javaensis]|uniref:tRNA modification GTPase gtpbp3, mitochondrial n=1 Tax=Coemansia javaensis TaxID=2761396 RepID=A0A9W8LJA5_9FUNG|nr:tRNA modification GTPase gtpbp3, mitochondrial [Coemansia javaensis]
MDALRRGLSGGVRRGWRLARPYIRPAERGCPERDTIFALSTRPGKAAIAIVRVLGRMLGPAAAARIRPRVARVGRIADPRDPANVLDTGVSLWFPGPASYTGEDMAEFHVHGGAAVVASVLDALDALPGLRPAEPGEFSRRAFDSGKMDLTALEGVADLINAETEAQRRLAVRQARGELHQRYDGWRREAIAAMAKIEAFIDFAEEEAIEDGVYEDARRQAAALAADVAAHLDDRRQGEIMRSGVALSIVGPPNSGKSTLLNKLAQRQVAIVSPVAGTTRDIVETTLDIGGYPVVVRDTAGLRAGAADVVEAEGIRRALDAAREADIRICMLDARRALRPEPQRPDPFLANPEWRALLHLPHTFVVLNKADTTTTAADNVADDAAGEWAAAQGLCRSRAVLLSCVTMQGWDPLMRLVAADIRRSWDSGDADHMPLTKPRHRHHLRQCLAHLREFERAGDAHHHHPVLAAEELRHAAAALGRITGRVDIEDVLDVLFSQFCIGK